MHETSTCHMLNPQNPGVGGLAQHAQPWRKVVGSTWKPGVASLPFLTALGRAAAAASGQVA